jgi:hypothetical protein
MPKIKFLREHDTPSHFYVKGAQANLPPEVCDGYISKGLAEYVDRKAVRTDGASSEDKSRKEKRAKELAAKLESAKA